MDLGGAAPSIAETTSTRTAPVAADTNWAKLAFSTASAASWRMMCQRALGLVRLLRTSTST